MNPRHLASPRPRTLAVIVAVLVAWASIAAVASAAPNKKTFTTTVTSPIVAGQTYANPGTPVVFSLTNTASSADLGSANVTVPTGVAASNVTSTGSGTATLVGSVIQLRNLALTPGQSVVVSMSAVIECGPNHAPYVWTTFAKQSNDFNGTGNDLTGTSPTSTIQGRCQLAFTGQPAHSEKTPVVITDTIYDPAGGPVTVTVLDGVGDQTVTWWSGTIDLDLGDDPSDGEAILSGGISSTVSGGQATFTPSINRSATGYSLLASASPTAGTPSAGTTSANFESANFNIVDDAEICLAGLACEASAGQGQKTSAHIAASSDGEEGDLIILTVDDPTLTLNCGGYTETSDIVSFDVTDSTGETPSDRSKIATLILQAQFVTRPANKYKVCFDNGVDQPFLLDTCDNQTPVPPCVVSRALDHDRNLVIVVSTPPGDPKLNF